MFRPYGHGLSFVDNELENPSVATGQLELEPTSQQNVSQSCQPIIVHDHTVHPALQTHAWASLFQKKLGKNSIRMAMNILTKKAPKREPKISLSFLTGVTILPAVVVNRIRTGNAVLKLEKFPLSHDCEGKGERWCDFWSSVRYSRRDI